MVIKNQQIQGPHSQN